MMTPPDLPHSRDLEMMVLGASISENGNFKKVLSELSREDFHINEHRALFSAFLELQHLAIDLPLVCEYLKQADLLTHVGGISYVVQLVHFSCTASYIDDYIQEIKRLTFLRNIALLCRKIQTKALQGKDHPKKLLEEIKEGCAKYQTASSDHFTIMPVADRITREEAFLDAHKGKQYLGLETSFIKAFNEQFLGLRGLNLLAAAPNCGKTALAIQLGIDAVMTSPDVCFVFISLEMSADEIFRRMILLMVGIDYRTFVFGSYGETQQNAIAEAKRYLSTFKERIQIIEVSSSSSMKAENITEYVNRLKVKTSCQRAMIVIDYLQVWPVREHARYLSENEMDKWRMGEMKKLRDKLGPDPIIVISEARKPAGKDGAWGGSMADVMGSARTTYTPDVVMLLTPVIGKHLHQLWQENRMPSVYESSEGEGSGIKKLLENQGITLCQLEVPKARDGMRKFNLLLEFHFQKNKFKTLDLPGLRRVLDFSSTTWSQAIKQQSPHSFAELFVSKI